MNDSITTKTKPNLREFLDQRFVRYTSLARELGISNVHLHGMMEGTRPITVAMADRLAAIFKVPASTFLPDTTGKAS